jgi:mevalonate kinase
VHSLAMTCASAAGKVILLGEHAVVYGQPAIAAPLSDLRATACVEALPPGATACVEAADLGRTYPLVPPASEGEGQALVATVDNTYRALGQDPDAAPVRLRVASQVPIARGLGSGTAVATAIVRALAAHFGRALAPQAVSDLVFQTEILLHDRPSGVDNTVVAHERPVWFARGVALEFLRVGAPLHLVIADTGIPSRTRDAVREVQRRWGLERIAYESRFGAIGETVRRAREALVAGEAEALGRLMDENQAHLTAIGVSCPEIDALVEAARAGGALGAKLSGGGCGGVVIALVRAGSEDAIEGALRRAGAAQTWRTTLRPAGGGEEGAAPC